VRASLAIHTLTHDKQGQQTNEQTAQNAFQWRTSPRRAEAPARK
jgi:hypothetical protein